MCMWREGGEEGYENLLAAKMEKMYVCVWGGGAVRGRGVMLRIWFVYI